MQGTLESGEGNAAGFVPVIEGDILSTAGFRPYPGTLNLRDLPGRDGLAVRLIDEPAAAMDNCDGVRLWPCAVDGIRAALLEPLVDGYPAWKNELVAPVHLRSVFSLTDGDTLTLAPPTELWHPDGRAVDGGELDGFDAVVFDLDGTLVDLAVDWAVVKRELRDCFDEDPFDERVAESVGEFARSRGRYDEFAAILEAHETAGGRAATERPLVRLLAELDCPVGVCTKNATRAATVALERFDARDAVDALVGRETTVEQKPKPEPLLNCLDRLDAEPGNAVFVGDDRSDCETARRAGTSFLHPTQLGE